MAVPAGCYGFVPVVSSVQWLSDPKPLASHHASLAEDAMLLQQLALLGLLELVVQAHLDAIVDWEHLAVEVGNHRYRGDLVSPAYGSPAFHEDSDGAGVPF